MRFRTDRPIFQQLIEHIEAQIVRGELVPEARIPAVRDFALAVEVNPNTVMKSFLALEEAGVIFKKRGLGYFVSSDAKSRIIGRRRRDFLEFELPEVMQKLHMLGIDFNYVKELYERSKP